MANARFIPSLESARGLAALSVCLFHASELRFQDGVVLAKDTAVGTFLNGYGAVVLFFVLSGFVLRSSLQKRYDARASELSADYLLARFFRLMPTIVATVLIFAGVAWLVDGREPQLAVVVRNALLLDTNFNGAFWTLQIELIGSAIVLVAFLLERRFGVWVVFAMLAALLPLSFTGTSFFIGSISPFFFYTFLLGYLVAVLPPLQSDRQWVAPALLCLGLLAFYAAYANGYVYKQWLLLVTALSSTLIVLVLSSDRCREWLQWPPVRFLGTVSYSFYALHALGLQVEGALRAPIERSGWPSWTGVAVMLVVPVIVTLIVAVPMYYWVERPGILLGRRIVARRGSALGLNG
jgi:peptidoglycan/LPS O-acetylase OafA/YrhL